MSTKTPASPALRFATALAAAAEAAAVSDVTGYDAACVELLDADEILKLAGLAFEITVQEGGFAVDGAAVEGSTGPAAALWRSGVEQLKFSSTRRSGSSLKRLASLLAAIMTTPESDDDPVSRIWRLQVPGLDIASHDPYDDGGWCGLGEGEGPAEPISDEELVETFLYRVRQAQTPLISAARARAARMALEGGVSGDSLSMESHFNIVFGRRRTPADAKTAGEFEEALTREPTLVEKLTRALRVAGDVSADEELRTLMREQLASAPKPADDMDLMRRAIAITRTLETSNPPLIDATEAAGFLARLLTAAFAIGDLDTLPALLDELEQPRSGDEPPSSLPELSKALTTAELIDNLEHAVERSLRQRGREHVREQVARVLSFLDESVALPMVVERYQRIANAEHREIFQTWLIQAGKVDLESLRTLLDCGDEALIEEGFEVLAKIGPEARELVEEFIHPGARSRRLAALKALRHMTLGKRDELRRAELSTLAGEDPAARLRALDRLASFEGDEATIQALEEHIQRPDFVERDANEQQRTLTTFALIGGDRAAATLERLANRKSAFEDGQTRRLGDAARAALEEFRAEGGDV